MAAEPDEILKSSTQMNLNGWTPSRLDTLASDVSDLKDDMKEAKDDIKEINHTLTEMQSTETKALRSRVKELETRPRTLIVAFGGPTIAVMIAELLNHIH